MASVDFRFTSDSTEVTKALEGMSNAMMKLREENRKLKEEGKAAAKAAKEMDVATSTFNMAAESAGDFLTNMVDIGKAIQFVVKELKELHAVQDRAAESARKVAGEQRSFLRNLGNVPDAERSQAIAAVKRISAKTGVDEATLYSA